MPRRLFIAAIALAFSVVSAPAEGLNASTDPEALEQMSVAEGNKDIAQAWLIEPTTIYKHFVQGRNYEASGLRLSMADGCNLTLRLDDAHVFEDSGPRLADLDGDGRDEIVLVLTSVAEGASLAAYAVEGDDIRLKAQTPYIGQPFRWLNPAGIADFDGDGRLDVAFVAMPHLVKRLEVWTLEDGAFRQLAAVDDVSNHRNGSDHTRLSAVADFDGDGIADLAVPNGDRSAIRVIGLSGGAPKEIARYSLPELADGDFLLSGTASGFVLTVRLETGRIAEVKL